MGRVRVGTVQQEMRPWRRPYELPGGAWAGNAMAVLLTVLLTGCVSMPQWGPNDREKLERASQDYNTLLRWKEPDKACAMYAEETVKGKCLERAQVFKDIQITDIRTRDIDFRIDGMDATVNVEIEYYALPSTTVRKILESQRWVYAGPLESRIWYIKSLFPDFKSP